MERRGRIRGNHVVDVRKPKNMHNKYHGTCALLDTRCLPSKDFSELRAQQIQNIVPQDLDWIFAAALDELLPNTGVGIGNLEATRAGAFNPEIVNAPSVPELPSNMGAVRTQGPDRQQEIVAYIIAL